MKHLRILNLLIVVLLLTAWAPAPQMDFSSQPVTALAAYAGTFSALAPANGIQLSAWPATGFTWTFKPSVATNTPDQYIFQVSTTTTFASPLFEDTVAQSGTTTKYTYMVDATAHPLPSNLKLYWRVKACKGDVAVATNCKLSATMNFLAKPYPVTTVLQPTDGAINLDTLRPTLIWQPENANTDFPMAKTYNIQLATTSDFKVGLKKYVAKAPFFDLPVDLVKNTTYYWKVQPVGVALGDFSATWSFTTPDKTAPAQPVLTFPANNAEIPNYLPTLKWKSTNPAATFYIQFSDEPTFSPFNPHTQQFMLVPDPVKDAAGVWNWTVPDDPQLQLPSAVIYWRIQAANVDLQAQTQMVSAWSKPFAFKTPSEITVRVEDPLAGPTGAPKAIENAKVVITSDSAGKIVLGTMPTDSNGLATIRGITKGTRYIWVTDQPDAANPDTHYYLPLKKAMPFVAGKIYGNVAAGQAPVFIDMVRPPVKIVFTWGATPTDMDSLLWLPDPLPTGESPIQINGDYRGNTTAFPWAKLQNDAAGTAKTKTETLIIQNRYPGKYVFAVVNKNGDFDPAQTFSAKVDYYTWNGVAYVLRNTFNAPTTAPTGRWWYVFDLDGETGMYTEVNTFLTYQQAKTTFPSYDPLGGYALPK